MVDKLTLKDFAELPEKILDTSKDIKYIQLLNDETIKCYFYSNLKKDLMITFNKFKDARYLIAVSEEYSLKSSISNLSFSRSKFPNNDKVGSYIQKKVDLDIWSKEFYNILMVLSKQVTFNEAFYLVSTFFEDKKEDEMCEILAISKKTLYKIKRSCLVKIKLEFDKYNII